MRHHPQQHFALAERGAHQPQRAVFQIAQAAMDQLRRSGRRTGREIALLEQHDLQPASRRIARDAGAVDAAANNSEIEVGHGPNPGTRNALFPTAGDSSSRRRRIVL